MIPLLTPVIFRETVPLSTYLGTYYLKGESKPIFDLCFSDQTVPLEPLISTSDKLQFFANSLWKYLNSKIEFPKDIKMNSALKEPFDPKSRSKSQETLPLSSNKALLSPAFDFINYTGKSAKLPVRSEVDFCCKTACLYV